MGILIRRASERGHANHGWLDSWHTFSFADYHDEDWMGFKTLRVINEDRIAPGKGFDLHGHRDMEILTYVMKGSLRHVDTMGNNEVLHAGEVQMMTAGTGIQHMEINASQTEECHLYQIWILPSHRNLTPSYAQKRFVTLSEAKGPSSKVLIASPDGRSGSLVIHQDAEVWLYHLEAGETATIEVPPGKAGWVQIVEGEAEFGPAKVSLTLKKSDGVTLSDPFKIRPISSFEAILFLL
jgi:redox-sensitive bicupin YhaK (pirin superfamily)